MRYIYYNAEWELIEIHPDPAMPNAGVRIGSISDKNFREVHLNFLVQSLLNLKKLEPKGLRHAIFEGPSKEPDPDDIVNPDGPAAEQAS